MVPGTIYRNQTISVGDKWHRNVTLMLMGPATFEDYVEHMKDIGESHGDASPDDTFWKVSVD